MEHPFAASTIQRIPDDDNASTTSLEAHNDPPAHGHLEPIVQEPPRRAGDNARHLREAEGTSKINAGEGQDDVGLRQRSQGSPFKLSQLDEGLELELHTSWVYSRPTHRHSISSFPSNINSTTGMSFLSTISLAQVSNISVFELPIFYHEIWNPQFYNNTKDLAIGRGQGRRRVGTSEIATTLSPLGEVSMEDSKEPTTGLRRLLFWKLGLPFEFTSRGSRRTTQVQGPIRRDEAKIIPGKLLILGG